MDQAELGRVLGRLQADAEEGMRQRLDLFRKLEDLVTIEVEQAALMKMLIEKSIGVEVRLEKVIMPVIADYQSLKLKGLGVLIGITLLASSAGVGIMKLIAMWLRGDPP